MSSDKIFSLWPEQIRPNVQSPMLLLKTQAEALASQTGGILLAEILRRSETGKVVISFDIVAPALGGYRHRLMSVAYQENMPYPCLIDSRLFRDSSNTFRHFVEKGFLGKPPNRADDDNEFQELLRQVFQSSSTIAIAQSLIAQATEALSEDTPQSQSTEDPSAETV